MPVLALLMEYAVTYDKPMTIVLIAPSKNRNERFVCSMNSLPKVAACPEPMPGRKEHKGANRVAAIPERISSFLVSFTSLSLNNFCSFGVVLVFILTIIPEIPKSPERRGRRG